MTATRLITPRDAEPLAALRVANRAHLAPFDPLHEEGFYTAEGQLDQIERALRAHDEGTHLPLVILDHAGRRGRIVGQITLSPIVRGVLQSGWVGYWVAAPDTRRGHASAALAELCEIAFDELGLHRLEAGTLPDNLASQGVLTRTGFSRYGYAPRYLKIAGRWQDHVLFQRLAPGD